MKNISMNIDDPQYPEFPPCNAKFPASPAITIPIPGFKEVIIKDESVHRWSGTHKDRMAWEVIVSYKNIEKSIEEGRITNTMLPHFSLISSGSAAIAVGRMLKEYEYPSLKVLSDTSLEKYPDICAAITDANCELYLADLSNKEISASETLWLTNNPTGFDLTDFHNTTRSMFNYDWLCYEILNLKPDYIFVPYGTGTLFREIINIIKKEVSIDTPRDKRLSGDISSKHLRMIHVLGATSNNCNTKADKLYTPYRPYHQRNLHEIYYYLSFGYIGDQTGVFTVLEKSIDTAYEIAVAYGVDCEYSGCAGLALLLQIKNTVPKNSKVVVINTGKLRIEKI